MKKLHLHVYILWLYMLTPILSSAQNSCSNIDFESGTYAGYTVTYGKVNGATITNLGTTIDDQHEIQWKIFGIDPIAEANCITNKNLPIVGEGSGQFSLRLGNQAGRNFVAGIKRDFYVTAENNFLILNYAVVLEDPSHPELAQPRFSLQLLDEAGNSLECGEYFVSSGPDVEGFENCGSWRIRPWTAVGFALDAYLGQTISIEITSVDCSYGGHGGYAYLDLACKPIEVSYDGYCEGNLTATLTVTEGFKSYLWHTGETTNNIEIENPVPGETFSVEVSSETGCSLILSDTLPPFIDYLPPVLEPFKDTTLCQGEYFFYKPEGENLERLELSGLGSFRDSLLINTFESKTYEIIAKDLTGCNIDTISFYVEIYKTPFITDIAIETCDNINYGEVTFTTLPVDSILFSLDGITWQSENFFPEVLEGNHTVYTRSPFGCLDSAVFDLILENPLKINEELVSNVNCHHKGSISLRTANMDAAFNTIFNGDSLGRKTTFSNLDTGTYSIILENDYGCKDSTKVTIGYDKPPEIIGTDISPYVCGPIGGTIEVNAEGISLINYQVNNEDILGENILNVNMAGTYIVTVRDLNNCQYSIQVEVGEIKAPITLSEEFISHPTCSQANGIIQLSTVLGYPEYIYSINGSAYNITNYFDSLSAGNYTFIVKDTFDCKDTLGISLTTTPPVIMTLDSYLDETCEAQNGAISVKSNQGTPPFNYTLNNSNNNNTGSFSNLEGGLYEIITFDSMSCTDTFSIELSTSTNPLITDIRSEIGPCGNYAVSINLDEDRGTPPFELSANNFIYPTDEDLAFFLDFGSYDVTISDKYDCLDSITINLDDFSELYIPNVISINSASNNERLIVYSSKPSESIINYMKVYDRWGNLVYNKKDLNINVESEEWWDGKLNGKNIDTGVYTYILEYTNLCNETAIETGTVTVLVD